MYQENPPIDELMHYGVGHDKGGHSGRYPWGSGDESFQRNKSFIDRVDELKRSGMTESEVAGALGIVNEKGEPSSGRLRARIGVARDQMRSAQVERAIGYSKDGLGATEIGRKMGLPESTVRSLLNEKSAARMRVAQATADFLKEQVDTKGMIDIGAGVERELGISREKLKQAVYILEMDGYKEYGGGVPQVTNAGKQTNLRVLCPPGTEHKEIYNFDKIHSIKDYYSKDGGETFEKDITRRPKSLDPKRLGIRYAEEGGVEKDGVIEIRRGCKDLDLGNSNYAQVRILVGGTHYLKGMAVYSDNLPDGVDIMFNTNKKKGTPPLGDDKNNTVLKKIKDDPDNPFGALIKKGGQSDYIGDDGKKHQSLINKTREEGDWDEWADKLPSQFLAKQNISLIKKQLNMSIEDKELEFKSIMELDNPTVRKSMLKTFADECDSAAIDLKAAALPRQKYQVILPVPGLKDTEIFAPNYENGEKVALVRYPHGGTFEIPILTVNNKNKEAINMIGKNALDAVGINSKVAERLSGADFDGDTAMVIPTGKNGIKISSTPPLKGLEGFDPKMEYGGKPAGTFKKMTNTQIEMGVVSNLITDMTIKGAAPEELARAVRHSMVVIDAEKHALDYQQSEKDNGIAELKRIYQGHYDNNGRYHEGASTILSKAKSQQSVDKRQGSPSVNLKYKNGKKNPDYDPTKPEGSLLWKTADDLTYVDARTGKIKRKTFQSTKMAETDDAYSLVSDASHPVERAYADYANSMKNFANQARIEMSNTGRVAVSKQAKEEYKEEVRSLEAKLNLSLLNAPRERQAQTIANSIIKAKKEAHPDMTKKEIKKESQRALEAARIKVGAKRHPIEITDREWEAIQKGAISETTLTKIINHMDSNVLKERATPRAKNTLSQLQISKINAMRANGYTNEQIAKSIGVSASTIIKYAKSK